MCEACSVCYRCKGEPGSMYLEVGKDRHGSPKMRKVCDACYDEQYEGF